MSPPAELGLGTGVLPALLAATPAYVLGIGSSGLTEWVSPPPDVPEPVGLTGRPVWELAALAQQALVRSSIEAVLAGATGVRFTAELDGGSGMICECTAEPVLEGLSVVGAVVVAMDSTRRHQGLAESEERYRLAMEATSLGIWSRDLRTGQGFWSDEMTRITGVHRPLSAEEFVELVHPEDRHLSEAAQQALLETGHFRNRVRIQRPGGSLRWIETTGRAIRGADGAVVRLVGSMRDITEERALERRARHAEKLDAIGRLTAGVAHNFNNLVMVLLPTLELLVEHVDTDGEAHLQAAQHVAQRAAELTRELMAFAEPEVGGIEEAVSLVEAVSGAVALARRAWHPHVGLVLIEEDDPTVVATASGITEIVMNLLFNARDALCGADGPGRVEVHVGSRVVDGERVGFVRVSDDGPGMDEAVARRVFDPFFTTKGMAGTGLGLAASFAVARRFEGDLTLQTAPSAGACFELTLPATTHHPTPSRAVSSEQTLLEMRLLLIDDEALIRRVVERTLVREGVTVVTLPSVAAARVWLEGGESFDVALVDRSMPGEHGAAIVPTLRAYAPRAKIAFFTGERVPVGERALADGVLNKPVGAAELIRWLRELVA